MSGWLLMGLPGLAYLGGIKEAFWTALGLILGTYLNWLFVARPLRNCTIAFGDSITIPEFFSNRFKDSKHHVHSKYKLHIELYEFETFLSIRYPNIDLTNSYHDFKLFMKNKSFISKRLTYHVHICYDIKEEKAVSRLFLFTSKGVSIWQTKC